MAINSVQRSADSERLKPILEMGCGDYSTPILHEICRIQRRRLVSLDNDYGWLQKFVNFQSAFHSIHYIENWNTFDLIDNEKWSFALIDHHPVERRKIDIGRLWENCDFLVIHDTEAENIYQYEEVLKTFKFRFDYKKLSPWTTVVSQIHPMDNFVGI